VARKQIFTLSYQENKISPTCRIHHQQITMTVTTNFNSHTKHSLV